MQLELCKAFVPAYFHHANTLQRRGTTQHAQGLPPPSADRLELAGGCGAALAATAENSSKVQTPRRETGHAHPDLLIADTEQRHLETVR